MRSPLLKLGAWSVAMTATASCVAVKSTSTYTEAFVANERSTETLPDSKVYLVTSSIRGGSLALAMASEETCRTSVTATYRKTEHVTRKIDPDAAAGDKVPPVAWLLTAAAVGGLGTFIYADADSLASQTTSNGQMNSPDDIRTEGVVIGLIAAPLLVVGVIDAMRLRDSDEDADLVQREPDVSDETCHHRSVVHQKVSISVPRLDWTARATSDDHGLATFALADLQEEAFRAGNKHDKLQVILGFENGDSTRVTLDSDATKELREALADDPATRVAADRAAAKAAAAAQLASAKANAAECQAALDGGSLSKAINCWQAHAASWSDLDVVSDDVQGCLTSTGDALAKVDACVSSPEATDSDVLAKNACLASLEATPTKCGPLDVSRLVSTRARDLAALKKQLETKAAAIAARQARAAEEERLRQAKIDAEAKRCLGGNVLQLVLALQLGQDVSPSALRGCTYAVAPGRIDTTTRDGWIIVSWGTSMTAGFKSSRRHADGSLFRTSARAKFMGLQPFDRVDGGSTTIAIFVLME